MRILLATPAFAPQLGGAETWTRAVFTDLARRGHEVRVVARAVDGLPDRHEVAGVLVERVRGGRAAYVAAVARATRRRDHDMVVAQYAALPAALTAGRLARVPVVAIVHDVYGWSESRRIKGFGGGAMRWLALEQVPRRLAPQRVLVPSAATAQRVDDLLPRTPVTVVPAGADHLPCGHERRPMPGRVVFVGRLVHQKGAQDLIRAVARLRAETPAVHAVVVGRGPLSGALRAQASPLGDAVEFREGIPDAELDELLSSAAVLALPSTREGWGLAVTEAAVRAVPYVAYDIPAVREQHQQLQGGVLVPPTADDLIAGLRRVLADPDAAQRDAATAATVAATMSWVGAGAVVESALAAVIREDSRARGTRR